MNKKRLGFHLVLLGQIASGKDTQALEILNTYNLKPVESGKHWRKLATQKSKDGELLRRTTGQGKPAPVALMKKFLIEQIENKPKNKDLIFIGNPRLKPEGQLLKKIMSERGEKFYAIYITLPDKEVFKRSFGRARDELDKKYINSRIKWHKDQVSKTVNYFGSLGKLEKINGNQSIKKVSEDIEKAITYFQKKIK